MNAAQQWVDIDNNAQGGRSAHFMVESAALDLFVMFGPTPKDVVRQFTDLTGKAHLPQVRRYFEHFLQHNLLNKIFCFVIFIIQNTRL